MKDARPQHARNLVVMLTAGGALDDVLEMATAFDVRPIDVQLILMGLPPEEAPAARRLIDALRSCKEVSYGAV